MREREASLRLEAAVAIAASALVGALCLARPARRDVPAPDLAAVVLRIDVDRAPPAELALLPGVGPALAARIAADRGERGPFGGADGLARVPGIGPRTVARLRPLVAEPAAP